MRVALTGATGFIGSHILTALCCHVATAPTMHDGLKILPGKAKTPWQRGFRNAPERTRTSTDHSVHKALNLARLPIPPQARWAASIAVDPSAERLPALESVRGPR
jgi:hypothetical protein